MGPAMPQNPIPDNLTPEAAARYLGGISRDNLYRLARKGVVPHFRVGSRIFFNRAVLDEWIRAGGSGRAA